MYVLPLPGEDTVRALAIGGEGSRLHGAWLGQVGSLACSCRASTEPGSARVEVSPRSSSPSATALRALRMILPLLVLGRSSVKIMSSGLARAPICLRTC